MRRLPGSARGSSPRAARTQSTARLSQVMNFRSRTPRRQVISCKCSRTERSEPRLSEGRDLAVLSIEFLSAGENDRCFSPWTCPANFTREIRASLNETRLLPLLIIFCSTRCSFYLVKFPFSLFLNFLTLPREFDRRGEIPKHKVESCFSSAH